MKRITTTTTNINEDLHHDGALNDNENGLQVAFTICHSKLNANHIKSECIHKAVVKWFLNEYYYLKMMKDAHIEDESGRIINSTIMETDVESTDNSSATTMLLRLLSY